MDEVSSGKVISEDTIGDEVTAGDVISDTLYCVDEVTAVDFISDTLNCEDEVTGGYVISEDTVVLVKLLLGRLSVKTLLC